MRVHLILFAAALALLAPGLAPGAEKAGKKSAATSAWPPKQGVKTPGVQIPFDRLKAEAEISIGGKAGPALFGESVFVPLTTGDAITRIDPKTNKPADPLKGFDKPCGGLVNAFGSLWVSNCGSQTLQRVEPKTGKVVATLGAGVSSSATIAMVADADSLWLLADDRTSLLRIDPADNSIVAELRLPAGCSAITFAEESLWIPCPAENRVLRVDPKTHVVTQRIETAAKPSTLAFGEASLWVLCEADGKVARIDPKTNKVTATIELGVPQAKGSIAFGEGSVWVTAPGFPVSRIQPSNDKVVQQFAGEGGGLLQFGAGSVWLAHLEKGTLWRLDPKRIVATLAD